MIKKILALVKKFFIDAFYVFLGGILGATIAGLYVFLFHQELFWAQEATLGLSFYIVVTTIFIPLFLLVFYLWSIVDRSILHSHLVLLGCIAISDALDLILSTFGIAPLSLLFNKPLPTENNLVIFALVLMAYTLMSKLFLEKRVSNQNNPASGKIIKRILWIFIYAICSITIAIALMNLF